jgi:predicted RNase H-like nuclease (RuvC/YqgF family)
MEFHDHTMISSEPPRDDMFGHAPWPEPSHEHVDSGSERTSEVTFDETFDALDRQTEHLRTLRGRLEGLCEYSNERDRKLMRLEQELAASRSETERERRVSADLRAQIGQQDQLLRSVRDTVNDLASTLGSAGSSWNETRAA